MTMSLASSLTDLSRSENKAPIFFIIGFGLIIFMPNSLRAVVIACMQADTIFGFFWSVPLINSSTT